MSALFKTTEALFGTRDLYKVLGIEKNASKREIKKAYFKQSRKIHPDRVKPKDRKIATKQFQAIGAVYNVLSNHSSRALYDEKGEVDEENGTDLNEQDCEDFWGAVFKMRPKISAADIKKFEARYKHSKEEEADLEKAYMKYEGDMNKIWESIPCSVPDDDSRFAKKITEWIANEKVFTIY